MIQTLFHFLSSVGSLVTGVSIFAFAVVAVGIIAGFAWEAFAFWFLGNIYGFGRGFRVGALAGAACFAYAAFTAATIGGAFLPVLGLVGVALVLLIAVKSYIGMQPIAESEWA